MKNWLSDFRDRRAQVVKSDNTWLDVIATGSSAIIALLPLVSKISDLASQIPYLWILLNVGLPLLACAALLFVVASKQKMARQRDSIIVGFDPDVFQYRFTQAKRQTAKFLLIPIVTVLAYELSQSLPNYLMGRTAIAGYVCSSEDGTPVQGSIQIVDANGEVVSRRTEALDRSGFFYAELRGWGFRPVAARLLFTACSKERIQLSSALGQTGCTKDGFAIKQPIKTRVLLINCGGKEKE
jgi:hypothetical protein